MPLTFRQMKAAEAASEAKAKQVEPPDGGRYIPPDKYETWEREMTLLESQHVRLQNEIEEAVSRMASIASNAATHRVGTPKRDRRSEDYQTLLAGNMQSVKSSEAEVERLQDELEKLESQLAKHLRKEPK